MLRLDFFPKFIDKGMGHRSCFGGAVSILSITLCILLVIAETVSYLNPPMKEQLVSVSDLSGSLDELVVSFNFTVNVPCPLLHLDAFDLSGAITDESRKSFFKKRIDLNNTEIKINYVADKCGSCYGAETDSRKCCATCDEIIAAYQEKGWGIADMPKWAQCIAEGIKLDGSEKCQAYGSLQIAAIEGGFHLAPGINVLNSYYHSHDFSPLNGSIDLSHEIDHVTFGNMIDPSPIDRTRVIQKGKSPVHYRYNLKVIPTVIVKNSKIQRGFKYTANYAEIPVVEKGRYGPGIFFVYSFAPVAILVKSDRISFVLYLSHIVSIIGGCYMLGKLIDSFGYRLHTIEGKRRIGKAE